MHFFPRRYHIHCAVRPFPSLDSTSWAPVGALSLVGTIPLPVQRVICVGAEVFIENPDADGNGEVLMRGRHVFMGYLYNAEKTKVGFCLFSVYFLNGFRKLLMSEGICILGISAVLMPMVSSTLLVHVRLFLDIE